jgi:hypothetical protein
MYPNAEHIRKKQTRRMETAEVRFIKAVAGYGMTDHRRNEDMDKLGISDINTVIKLYAIMWVEYLERKSEV